MINDFEICLLCGKPGSHYSVEIKGFTCQLDESGKLQTKFNEFGNETA